MYVYVKEVFIVKLTVGYLNCPTEK